MSQNKEVSFYHLTTTPLEKALPSLALKMYDSGQRAIIVCSDENQMRNLNDILWSFSTKKFIPHGSTENNNIEQQPILLTTSISEMRNSPTIALILNNQDIKDCSQFSKYLYMVYGNDSDDSVKNFYKLHNEYNKLGYKTTLWSLGTDGSWTKRENVKVLD